MLRREFIGGSIWAAVTARVALRAGPGSREATLLALAEVIVPDRDTAVWSSGEVADSFLATVGAMKGTPRTQVEKVASGLDAASTQAVGRKFATLSLQDRTSLVKGKLGAAGDFGAGFSVVRTASVDAFYSSAVGRKRTGYDDTTQFVGYPEYVRLAETWE
jgi:hypothetical protein